jgi:predicted HNH restriction endonuclease
MRLTMEQVNKLREILNVDTKDNLMITYNTNGFNVRIKTKKKIGKIIPFIETLKQNGMQVNFCRRCVRGNYGDEIVVHLHGHHIIPKSAGGKDDPENGIILCDKCHEGLHAGRWHIISIIGHDNLEKLRKKYKVKYGVII